MATLTYAAATKSFVWEGSAAEAGHPDMEGWTRTTVSPRGTVRLFTADYSGQPMFNPWAALPHHGIADAAARDALRAFVGEYDASFALDAPDPAPMPPGEALMPFQRAGVAYALRRERTLLGDPMGLGKSIQAMAFCNAVEARRILILCPASVVLQWRDYAKRWLVPLGAPVSVFVVAGSGFGVHPSARVVVASHDRARGEFGKRLLECEWDVLVIDEAHNLRNHTAGRTRAILGAYGKAAAKSPGIASRAKRVLALTGTPLPSRPRECYTLARALDWESISFLSEEAFQGRFNPSKTIDVTRSKDGRPVKLRLEATGRLPELNARLRCGFMVRREKYAAAPQLPAVRYSVVSVGSKETAKVVEAERLLDIDPLDLSHVPMDQQGHIAALRREMGIAMLPVAAAYIGEMLAAEPDPVVVFAWHREVVAGLAEALAEHNPVVVTGSTSLTGRRLAVDTFRAEDNVRLFIGQILASGTGVDGLQGRASACLFVEPSWVPGDNEQAIARLARIGQGADKVLAVFLVAPESLNEKVLQRTVSKVQVQHAALDKRPEAA